MSSHLKKPASSILLLIAIFLFSSCTQQTEETSISPKRTLRLAVTTSSISSGLFDKIIPVFESKHAVKVDVTANGSGAALQLAREGGADLVLVHAREKEDQFISEGYGLNRKDVMYNEFILVGPLEDPLQIKEETDLLEIFRKIDREEGPFISRGDQSGTHTREQAVWKLAGIQPEGDWYHKSGTGMAETLKMASARKAYTLTDEGSYLNNKDQVDLIVVLANDNRLFNPYGIIAVNPETVPDVEFQLAMHFIDFITSDEGQDIIAKHGQEKHGKSFFTPLAKKQIRGW